MNGLGNRIQDSTQGTLGVGGHELTVRSAGMLVCFSPATSISLGAGTE